MPASARRPRRRRLTTTAALAVAALAAPLTSAHAAGPRPLLPHGARDTGAVAAATPLRATVALRPRHAAELAAYAAAVTDPESAHYHRYLSVARFRARFAPTPAAVATVRAALVARGLRVGAVTANGLAITARGSAATADAAFATRIDSYSASDGTTGYAPTGTATLSGAAGALVQGVVGLSSAAPTTSVAVGRPDALSPHTATPVSPTAVTPTAAAPTTAGPQPCAAARTAAAQNGSLTADAIATRYGLSNYYTAGDEGRGLTIALYELEPFSATDIAAYQACLGTATNVSVEAVDGGAGVGPGSGEAAMDVEDVIGLAPQAQIRVYEGPQTGIGAYDTYSAIVADDAASIVSTSWGICESEQGLAAASAENILFQEAAVQGQTILAAAGDSGADDCGNGQLSVDDPASQPWVTAVGGTTARASGDTVWNDALGAGGGGASQFWGRPSWQTASQPQSSVTCGLSGTSCREIPDISADADPSTGYTAYYRGSWRTIGGTSVSAPTIAALVALANASPACAAHRLGFLDPALYADAADLHDVTAGSNTYDGVAGYTAGPGYDMASGLGTPTAALGPALCGDSASLAAVPAQAWTTARAAALSLHATSALGAAFSYTATGLPAGVTVNRTTGAVSGTPTAAGRFPVTVTATDADGATASQSFVATVTASATAARTPSTPGGTGPVAIAVRSLPGLSGRVGHPFRIRIRASAGGRTALRFVASGLPHGLSIDSRTGVIAGTPLVAGQVTSMLRISSAAGGSRTVALRWTITASARQAHVARAHHTHHRSAGRRHHVAGHGSRRRGR